MCTEVKFINLKTEFKFKSLDFLLICQNEKTGLDLNNGWMDPDPGQIEETALQKLTFVTEYLLTPGT